MPQVTEAVPRLVSVLLLAVTELVKSLSQSVIPLGCRSAAWLEVPLSFLRRVPRGVLLVEVFLL